MNENVILQVMPCEGISDLKASVDEMMDEFRAVNPGRPESHNFITLVQCLTVYFRDLPTIEHMSDSALEAILLGAYREIVEGMAEARIVPIRRGH